MFYYDASQPEREDYLQRVNWESGWDNSVRWDKGITEYWTIDLNSFMVMCYNEKNGIFENYDSITGEGQRCENFSCSCAFIIEFILGF